MKRREFIAGSCLAGLASLSDTAGAADEGPESGKEFYELRTYRLDSESKKEQFMAFLGTAAISALNRIGIAPVGVFVAADGDAQDVHVLLPHKSLESVVMATARLMADEKYLEAGAELLGTAKSDAAYSRIESSLMVAFDGLPKLETPSKNASRVFQLRTYESHNVKAGQLKIEMFNTGGEIAIFRRTGLHPVFFGETLIGGKLPNLTYMVGFDDRAASEGAWKKFGDDPDWKALRVNPRYKDTVSNIVNTFLHPASCSQI